MAWDESGEKGTMKGLTYSNFVYICACLLYCQIFEYFLVWNKEISKPMFTKDK